jgi:hypothetical protein
MWFTGLWWTDLEEIPRMSSWRAGGKVVVVSISALQCTRTWLPISATLVMLEQIRRCEEWDLCHSQPTCHLLTAEPLKLYSRVLCTAKSTSDGQIKFSQGNWLIWFLNRPPGLCHTNGISEGHVQSSHVDKPPPIWGLWRIWGAEEWPAQLQVRVPEAAVGDWGGRAEVQTPGANPRLSAVESGWTAFLPWASVYMSIKWRLSSQTHWSVIRI